MMSIDHVLRYSDPSVAAFVCIPALLVVLLLWGAAHAWRRDGSTPAQTRRAVVTLGLAAGVWMAGTWLIAGTGILREWDRRPPPFAFLVASVTILACALAFSGLGRRLARWTPLWALVCVQGFRLPLEIAMHAMYERGIMPREMSYAGRNFDILTGLTAFIVAALLVSGRGGRRLVTIWNLCGLALLINVVTVAILGTPRFRYFGDDSLNIWVTYPPFIWLPAVMVLAALAGHLVILRALRMRAGAAGRERDAA